MRGQLLQKCTGYDRPEDMDIDPIAAAKGANPCVGVGSSRPIRQVEARFSHHPLTSIILSFAFLLASWGVPGDASQRSTCANVSECLMAGSRTSTSRVAPLAITSPQMSLRNRLTARTAAS